jgi:mono/diheme cytochrome c family protein
MRFQHASWGLSILLVMTGAAAGQPQQVAPGFDAAAVERGHQLLTVECGFCHGSNARGGAQGSDLTRSALVQNDDNGKQLGEFLRVGRPDRGMPRYDLTEAQVADLAAYLHSSISLVANRRLYQILDIVVGDPKAGETFFNGPGKCGTCHSAGGDLKGVGSKYDPVTLQGRILMPRSSGRGTGPAVPTPAYLERNAVRATVTLPSGQSFSGTLVRVSDFDVTLYDLAAGQQRSWLRSGDVPKVTLTDPLQAHVDMWTKWTDADMHNMTAYLASLK